MVAPLHLFNPDSLARKETQKKEVVVVVVVVVKEPFRVRRNEAISESDPRLVSEAPQALTLAPIALWSRKAASPMPIPQQGLWQAPKGVP